MNQPALLFWLFPDEPTYHLSRAKHAPNSSTFGKRLRCDGSASGQSKTNGMPWTGGTEPTRSTDPHAKPGKLTRRKGRASYTRI